MVPGCTYNIFGDSSHSLRSGLSRQKCCKVCKQYNIDFVAYIESAPNSNPTISKIRKYSGIGSVLLAFGIQLSLDYGYDGTIFLQAKTSEILTHYIRNFGAVQYDHSNPFMLLIDGLAAQELFQKYLLEE